MTTLSIQPSAGTDDGNSGTGSGYNHTGGGMQLGGYFGTANGWLRAVNVTIAPGAVISSCTAQGDRMSSAGTAELRFRFVKEANPTYPTSGSDYDGRTLTTASVTGSYSGTGAWTGANAYTAAQEVIDQGSWASGNAQIMFILDNNSNGTHGGSENRIQVRTLDGGTNYPSLNWTYTTPITAAVPVGTVTITGVVPTAKKTAGITPGTVTLSGVTPSTKKSLETPIGTVTFSGVTPAKIIPATVSVGTLTLTGVEPSTTKQTQIPIDVVTFSGISPDALHRVEMATGTLTFSGVVPVGYKQTTIPTGTVTITGVTPGNRNITAVPIGYVQFIPAVANEIQEVDFGGGTAGSLWIGINSLNINLLTDISQPLSVWQVLFNQYGSVASTPRGLRFTFDNSSYDEQDIPQFEIVLDGTDGSGATISTVRHGGNGSGTITVQKRYDTGTGTVTISGVELATTHVASVTVGTITFSGLTPETNFVYYATPYYHHIDGVSDVHHVTKGTDLIKSLAGFSTIYVTFKG